MNSPLYDKLIEYNSKDIYPFHMPGHKRQVKKLGYDSLLQFDITEIDGFDNLHEPQGIILQSEKNASLLYNTLRTYFLVNGSTVGILAAITSQCKKKSKVIIARNCHKSVYHALELNELDPIYIYPDKILINNEIQLIGGVNPIEIDQLLMKHKDVSAVIITSPTYEGVISNISEIREITNKYNTILIVDEAHGAHLGLTNYTEDSAINLGADIVIQSLHKTLPALTQTALLHVVTDKVNVNKLRHSLSIFQTSSPSYLLMASIDRCVALLLEDREKLFKEYIENIVEFRHRIYCLENFYLIGKEIENKFSTYKYDISKLVFGIRGNAMDGHQLAQLLRNQYKIEIEYASTDYIVALTSIFDEKRGFQRFENAIIDIDKKWGQFEFKDDSCGAQKSKKRTLQTTHGLNTVSNRNPIQKYTVNEAMNMNKIKIELIKSTGKVCGDYLIPYPPGIPLLVPGETIEESTIDYLRSLLDSNIQVLGIDQGNILWIINEEIE